MCIVDIMLIISVIAVRLHTHLNVDFYGRFTPSNHRHESRGAAASLEFFRPLDHFCPPAPGTSI